MGIVKRVHRNPVLWQNDGTLPLLGLVNNNEQHLVRGTPQLLSTPDFASATDWIVGGDFAISLGVATYTHATGNGTLLQLETAFLEPFQDGQDYEFTYEVTANTGDIDSLFIPRNSPALQRIPLPRTVGTHTVRFRAAAGATAFLVQGTSGTNTGTLSIDNVSLKRVSGGNDSLSVTDGDATWFEIDVRGAKRLYIQGSFNVVDVGGLTGALTNQNTGIAAIGVPYLEDDVDLRPRVLDGGPVAGVADEGYNHVVLSFRPVDRRVARHTWAGIDEVIDGPGLFGYDGETTVNGLKASWIYEIHQRNHDVAVGAPRTTPTSPTNGDFDSPIEGLSTVWLNMAFLNAWALGSFDTTLLKGVVRAVMFP